MTDQAEIQLWTPQRAGELIPHVIPVTEHRCGAIKPDRLTGLWTSTMRSRRTGSAWTQWCCEEDYLGPSFKAWTLVPDPAARIYTIDTHEDLKELACRYSPICDHPHGYCRQLSWSSGVSWRRVAEDYDGVHLTDEGQWKTRLSHPYNLYGWDCESTLWFRWVFIDTEYLGKMRYGPRHHGRWGRRSRRNIKRSPLLTPGYCKPAPIKPSIAKRRRRNVARL